MSGSVHNKQLCTFFQKVGACRHGDKCVRTHVYPKHSRTILFPKLYDNPKHVEGLKKGDPEPVAPEIVSSLDETQIQQRIDSLYKDVFVELALKYGPVDKIVICENVNPHLSGNVYVRFRDEADAMKCYKECNDRWYNGKPVFAELSPVTNLDDATCRLYYTNECDRGGMCNFIHERRADSRLERDLFASQRRSMSERRR
ncbi:hypothetical protein KL918_002738 [Ogataea parapolymorpha]|uniref:Splicing factor U2AF subunit n=1 Tax=Ogataea parapolymorpha (strain ATCC 26012 / BCRC 20466 / JCM 22074 / NRRL Y-7560 / DL-1) TaxID=871575 RepID=W1QHH6_OGAPD|nr:splicing factor U2AF subunit [Ogataea parapolymorpha DL-1]ESX01096.1 splicing factor U2AF subunit [Ogataea parapolymorpha DL-1]KAG7867299.1 hypothetical protein KL918_002738 [Ogataea parapolymorpha]KAG7871025.1 hypothetical protein KL916_004391 [Ogataea parapolymorpha]KAG7883881.1 hypothetical protein KL938_002466 [Ogataea parapolymorpha]